MKVISLLLTLSTYACVLGSDANPEQKTDPEHKGDGPATDRGSGADGKPEGTPSDGAEESTVGSSTGPDTHSGGSPPTHPKNTQLTTTPDIPPVESVGNNEDEAANGLGPDIEDEVEEHISSSAGKVEVEKAKDPPVKKNYGKYAAWENLAKKIDKVLEERQKKAEELANKITDEGEKKKALDKVEKMKEKVKAVKAETKKIMDLGNNKQNLKGEDEEKISQSAFQSSGALFHTLKEYHDENIEVESDYIKAAVKEKRGIDVLNVITARITVLSSGSKTVSILGALVPILIFSLSIF
ncbi:signal peptide containing protein [Theileria equi strain WA]|uniref:Signal peptide containing protein n=1 Tax=Theileria equi strain WA TaxID=1537102 RepID=L1LAQ5_THEEQ|nr:signal peptide containing protein [Theileria equi strain WA]EKX72329.1 signal peptide containing protein [Theileria equi strain WA]|eukprot:XP_004831781.1 signal peptide containing protein [Theileria equi strain WA]